MVYCHGEYSAHGPLGIPQGRVLLLGCWLIAPHHGQERKALPGVLDEYGVGSWCREDGLGGCFGFVESAHHSGDSGRPG